MVRLPSSYQVRHSCAAPPTKQNEDNDLHRTNLLNLLAVGLIVIPATTQAEDFPRAGYEGAPNGLAAPFAGNWSLGFPEPEGTIVSTTTIDCVEPVRIERTGNASIAFKTPGMPTPVPFELDEFEGRTTWFPADNSQTVVTVWLTDDSFHFYTTSMGRVDWTNPSLMKRCDD
jgi:hypothetical protein